jgi:lysozyme family protein
MSVPSYGSRWSTYAKQWDAMTILPARLSEVRQTAKRLTDAKPRYQAVEKATGVPWYMIAAIHERESSQSWKASLAQGDPWDRVSTHVPRGRGPFKSWEAAAIDALALDGLTKVIDWRLEKIFYYLELYNGWGYHAHGVPSPYLFGATNIQKPGKYVADEVWSASAVDEQVGCAALIKVMMDLDASIEPIREEGDKSPIAVGEKPTAAPMAPSRVPAERVAREPGPSVTTSSAAPGPAPVKGWVGSLVARLRGRA